jgi:L,D-peptidoglycan transpeptidase YkuD (ErfK/YbiS/YcfS/YnhG family)
MLLASQLVAAALALACPPSPAERVAVPADARQLVTVEAASTRTTHATLRLWRRVDATGCWDASGGPWPARVGRNGLSANRHEGDGTTPLGTFAFGTTMYGVASDPGVRFRYHRLVCGDWWNEDVSSSTYNTFQHVACGARPPFSTKSEGLWQQPTAYVHFAVIAYNTRPVVAGRGSGIFLHAQTGGPTNGCVSLTRATLVRVLRWLDPAASPRIAIATSAQLR